MQGLGSAGGFKMMLQDQARARLATRSPRPHRPWSAPPTRIPPFAGVFTLFNAGSPSVYADIDRLKAEKVGLTPTDVFNTLQVYLGSQYVNDFNYLGRTFQVIAQADGQLPADRRRTSRTSRPGTRPARWCRSARWPGCAHETAPYRVPRYNLFPAAEVQGVAAPGVATGTALQRMEELAHEILPRGIGFEWTELALPATAARHADPARLRCGSTVRLPRAGRAV